MRLVPAETLKAILAEGYKKLRCFLGFHETALYGLKFVTGRGLVSSYQCDSCDSYVELVHV